jgi:hypothetical protein
VTIDPPGSISTYASSINGKGQIAGFYNNNVNGNSGGTNFSFLADPSGPISAVPEPATWAMMLIGFAGIVLATYHRRKKSTAAPAQNCRAA